MATSRVMLLLDAVAAGESLCVTTDIDLFFPRHGNNMAIARKLCARCQICESCLELTLELEGHETRRWGFAGGLSPRQRIAEVARRDAEAGLS